MNKVVISILSLFSALLLGCGSSLDENESSLKAQSGFWQAQPNGVVAAKCLDHGILTIADNHGPTSQDIKISIPILKDCQLSLSGTEPLDIIFLPDNSRWNGKDSYNLRIKHRYLNNKCLSFGGGGGIMNVSWQDCAPKGSSNLETVNAQQWAIFRKPGGRARLISYMAFILKWPNPKEMCLELGPPGYRLNLKTCSEGSFIWDFR